MYISLFIKRFKIGHNFNIQTPRYTLILTSETTVLQTDLESRQ